MYFTSSRSRVPRYSIIFAFGGVIVSVYWIYIIANLLLNILQAVAFFLNLDKTFLGFTLLAWGNSIGGKHTFDETIITIRLCC